MTNICSLPSISRENAAAKLNIDINQYDLNYYAWPQLYGDTSGPFGGCGGQALTMFTLEAWTDESIYSFFFCNGRPIKKPKYVPWEIK
jgi:hypothetical protein